jgi:hypothetical protein
MQNPRKKISSLPKEKTDNSLKEIQAVEPLSLANQDTLTVASVRENSSLLVEQRDTLIMPALHETALSSVEQQDTLIMPVAHKPVLPSAVQQSSQPFSGEFQHTSPSALDQETMTTPAVHESDASPTGSAHFLQRAAAIILVRAKESEPEGWSHTLRQRALQLQSRPVGWTSIILLIQALGVCLITYASVASLQTSTDQDTFLWLGFLVVFSPAFLRILLPIASRAERIVLLSSVGLCIYLAPQIISPLHYIFVDEYMHLRTVNDIVNTHHLFADNSILPISPLYPGLELVTAALSSVTGLSTLVAGFIVIAVARIVVLQALFALLEQVTRSSRTASIAVMIYMANSGFFMFDSLFLYESLGMALGIFMIFALYRSETTEKGKRGFLLVACLALGALTVTHHVADFFFIGLLLLWTVVNKLMGKPLLRSNITLVTFFALLLAGLWIFFVARPVIGYLSSPITAALAQVQNILTGSTGRQLFVDHTGTHPTPLWERFAMMASLGFVTLGLPFAFIVIWHRYRSKVFHIVLALLSLLFPVIQLLRLTSDSTGLPDRASAYLFIAVGLALALLITQMWPVRKLKWHHTLVITVIISLVFLGGNILGAGPSWGLMPGSYRVGDDGRSVDLESIQTALWTLEQLGSNNRMYADSSNSLLLNSYGEQHIVTMQDDGVDIAPVYYASTYDSWETALLQAGHVRYLVVDMRLSTSLPVKGYYFDGTQEPDINVTVPLSRQALLKFNVIQQVNEVYDSGDIIIYDVGGLTNAAKTP